MACRRCLALTRFFYCFCWFFFFPKYSPWMLFLARLSRSCVGRNICHPLLPPLFFCLRAPFFYSVTGDRWTVIITTILSTRLEGSMTGTERIWHLWVSAQSILVPLVTRRSVLLVTKSLCQTIMGWLEYHANVGWFRDFIPLFSLVLITCWSSYEDWVLAQMFMKGFLLIRTWIRVQPLLTRRGYKMSALQKMVCTRCSNALNQNNPVVHIACIVVYVELQSHEGAGVGERLFTK